MNKANFPVLSAPLWVGIAITNKCNLKCVHCIYSAGNVSNNELTTSEVKNLIKQCKDMGVYTIEFLGGEPFCREDLNELIDEAYTAGLGVVLNTNATLITPEWIDNYYKKIMLFKIGFDGSTEEYNSFRKGENVYQTVVSSIKQIQKKGVEVCLITTLHKGNVNKLEDIVKKSKELLTKGVFTITILTPRGRAKDISDLVLSKEDVKKAMLTLHNLKKKYQTKDGSFLIKEELPESITLNENLCDLSNGVRVCTAAVTQMGISSDGWAYPCTTMIGVREDDHNVRKHDLKDIWKNSRLFVSVRDREDIVGKCKTCEFLYKCGGGCRYAAWALTGTYQNPDPFCWYEPSN